MSQSSPKISLRMENESFLCFIKEFGLSSDPQKQIGIKTSNFVDECQETVQKLLNSCEQNLFKFSKVFKQLDMLFDAILQRVAEGLKQKEEVDTTLLQSAIQIVQVLSVTLEQIFAAFAQHKNVNIVYGDTAFSSSTLRVIYQSYQHCKSSEIIYGMQFSLVSSALGELFRKTFSLQKIITIFLNKVDVPEIAKLNSSDKNCFSKVCELLLNISSVVVEMDNTLIGSTWKLLSSFMVRCKVVLASVIDLQPFIAGLSQNAKHFAQRCRSVMDNSKKELLDGDLELIKSVTVDVRMTSFFTGLLVNLLTEFNAHLSEDLKNISQDLLFSILDTLEPFLMVNTFFGNGDYPAVLHKVVSTHLVKELDRCIAFHLSSQPFQTRIFDERSRKEDLQQLMIIMRLVKICANDQPISPILYGNKSLKDEDGFCIFSSTFNLVDRMYPTLMLSPVIYLNEEPTYLYDAVASHLSAAVVGMPATYFPYLERLLLNAVVNGGPFSHMLASDVWCFLARFSSADLCNHHVSFFASSVLSCDIVGLTPQQERLGSLMSRLFALLLPEHQMALMTRYPFLDHKNIVLWYFLGAQFFKLSQDSKIICDVCDKSVDSISRWTQDGCSVSGIPVMLSHLRVVGRICEEAYGKNAPTSTFTTAEDQHALSSVGRSLAHLWAVLPCSSDAETVLSFLFTDLLSATSHFIGSFISADNVLNILQHANKLLSCQGLVSEAVVFGCAKMLSSLRYSVLAQLALTELISLWRAVLTRCSDFGWLLRHTCLVEFEAFSHATKHPKAVSRICSPSSMAGNNPHCDVGSIVKAHLKRDIPPLNDIAILEVLSLHQKNRSFTDSTLQDNENNAKLDRAVKDIVASANLIRSFSQNLSKGQRSSLKEVVLEIQQYLVE